MFGALGNFMGCLRFRAVGAEGSRLLTWLIVERFRASGFWGVVGL